MSIPFVNLAAERSLLSAMVTYHGLALHLSASLRTEDFYDHRHAAIFRLWRDGELATGRADYHANLSELARVMNADSSSANTFLAEIRADPNGSRHAAVQNAELVAKLGKARRAFHRFSAMATIHIDADADDYLTQVCAFDLSDLDDGARGGRWMSEIMTSIRDSATGKKPSSRVHRSGIDGFDYHFNGGLRDAGLYVIGGIPGSGKSALAGQIAANVAKSGQGSVVLATLEMDGEQVGARLVAGLEQCSVESIERGTCADFLMKLDAGAALDMFIIEKSPLTIDDVRVQSKLIKSQRGLSLIVVDYLHLIDAPGKTQLEQLTHVTKRCKQMASELKCPVILLSSFNRTAFDGGKPSMRNFKGSGSIESDATALMVVHRQFLIDKSRPEDFCELNVLKYRAGRTGDIMLRYIGRHLRFTDWRDGEEDEQQYGN